MSPDPESTSTRTFSPKEAALSFLRLAATDHVREAYSAHVGPGFRHHNPHFHGDADSLRSAMEAAHTETREQTIEVHRAVADGDLVAVHSHVVPAPGDDSMVRPSEGPARTRTGPPSAAAVTSARPETSRTRPSL